MKKKKKSPLPVFFFHFLILILRADISSSLLCRACDALRSCLPDMLRDATFNSCLRVSNLYKTYIAGCPYEYDAVHVIWPGIWKEWHCCNLVIEIESLSMALCCLIVLSDFCRKIQRLEGGCNSCFTMLGWVGLQPCKLGEDLTTC